MEQLPLDLPFVIATSIKNEPMTPEELVDAYKQAIGVDPLYRSLTHEEMVNALKDPPLERARLAEVDRTSDQEDIFNTYRRN